MQTIFKNTSTSKSLLLPYEVSAAFDQEHSWSSLLGLPSQTGPLQLMVDLVFRKKSRFIKSAERVRGGGWSCIGRCGYEVVIKLLFGSYEISFYIRAQETRHKGLALLVTT